jgi:hypothetical protein
MRCGATDLPGGGTGREASSGRVRLQAHLVGANAVSNTAHDSAILAGIAAVSSGLTGPYVAMTMYAIMRSKAHGDL